MREFGCVHVCACISLVLVAALGGGKAAFARLEMTLVAGVEFVFCRNRPREAKDKEVEKVEKILPREFALVFFRRSAVCPLVHTHTRTHICAN